MKITKEKLNQIIKEEIATTVEEGFFSKLFNRPDKRWAAELKNIDKAMDRAKKDVNNDEPPREVLEAIEEIEATMAALQGGEPTDAQIEERDQLRRELKALKRRQEDRVGYADEQWRDDRQRAQRAAERERKAAAEKEARRQDRESYQIYLAKEKERKNRAAKLRGGSKYDPGSYQDHVYNVGNLEESVNKKDNINKIIKEELTRHLEQQQDLPLRSKEENDAYEKWQSRHPDNDLPYERVEKLYRDAFLEVVRTSEVPADDEAAARLNELVWQMMDAKYANMKQQFDQYRGA